MGVIKYLTPEETADYFKEHKKELEDTRVIIAEDPATDLTMYMTNENSTCFLSLYDADIQRRAVYLDGEDAYGIADEVLSCYIEFFKSSSWKPTSLTMPCMTERTSCMT